MTPGLPRSLPLLDELLAGARILRELPGFLRRPMTVEHARTVLQHRLAHRESAFLERLRRDVFGQATSLYLRLLRLAGCELGDVERLVPQEGVEGALRVLFRHGVYLTLDEFKGRRPVVRGSATLSARPLPAPKQGRARDLPLQSSGSRGLNTPVMRDLAYIRELSVDRCVALAARGGFGWSHAHWGAPGITAAHLIEVASFGVFAARWFSLVSPTAPGLSARYRWSMRLIPWAGKLAGVPLPQARYVPVSDPLPVARWLASVLQDGGTPHLWTYPSAAVRLCQAAARADIELSGTQLTVASEPVTPARMAVIREAGAHPVARYASVEIGSISFGCLAPEAADEQHLTHDFLALIQPGADTQAFDLPERALLFSSLSSIAPLTLLNVSLGDQAVVTRRRCGCALEGVGWTTHLHTIRSYERVTGGAVTLRDADLVRVLEEVLPSRFGGAPTDYQLVEEEATDGRGQLQLLVHPAIGPLDADQVVEVFIGTISVGDGSEPVFGHLLRDGGLIQVVREAPRTTSSGKILHRYLGTQQTVPS